MSLFQFSRKLTALVVAGVMGFFLVACGGGPSKEAAGDFVLEIVESLYEGDTDPIMDSLNFDNKMIGVDEDQLKLMAEGKLASLARRVQENADKHGGVEKIEITSVEQVANEYTVSLLVSFQSGKTEKSVAKVGWSNDEKKFFIIN